MKYKIVIISFLISFSGCSLVSQAPSLQYCSKVNYSRIGNQITLNAECAAPIAQTPNLPIPLPAPLH